MPLPIMALVGMAASAYAAKKQRDAQERASRESAGQAQASKAGGADAFGDNTHAGLLDKMSNTGVQQQFQAPPPPPVAPQAPLAAGGPGIAQIAPPQQPIQQPAPASTYSSGVDTQNIAPPVGGSTGEVGGALPLNLESSMGPEAQPSAAYAKQEAMGGPGNPYMNPKNYGAPDQGVPPMLADPNNPLNDPTFGTGEKLIDPNAGGQRLQDFMGVAGPMAGMVGAGIGASRNAGRTPGSGGFPARGGWNMPPSLAVAAQYNRRRR